MNLKKSCLLILFSIGISAFGQVIRPNATPYTNETVFEKFKKKYPFLTPIDRPVPTNIIIEKEVEYANMNGLSLKADLYYPTDQSKKYPAIAMIHGGGWISGSK